MKAGESVLVHGASGGVSTFLSLFLNEHSFVGFTFKSVLKAKFINMVKGAFSLYLVKLL